jgi:AcrR family transcriptional regulator
MSFNMASIGTQIRFDLNEHLFLKDPLSSQLGLKVVRVSIDMIDEIGYESYTFRKLAQEIGSTEASIYRYFENKHKVLLYLSAWYWNWMEYRLTFRMANIGPAEKRLDIAIMVLTEPITEDGAFAHVNEVKLSSIIIGEASKGYLNKEVDKENQQGTFHAYKRIVRQVSEIILEIDPRYKFPHMLVSTMVEGAHLQRFFKDHLPGLTDTMKGKDAVTAFYQDLLNKALTRKK